MQQTDSNTTSAAQRPTDERMSDTEYLQTHDTTPSFWSDMTRCPPDPVFGLIHGFLDDQNSKKVLLGVGAYRDDDGKPVVLESVKQAERNLMEKQVEKEYSFPDGIPSFRRKARELAFGKQHPAIQEDRICNMQTVSGTGALALGFKLMRMHLPKTVTKAYTTNVRWSLHNEIVPRAGFELCFLRYYDPVTKGLDIKAFLEDLENIEDESLILLQTSAQNPSGVDPSKPEWLQVFEIIKRKRHFIFFDTAYCGFASDDFEEDLWSLRTLSASYYRVMLAQSFSKNFGLYGERTGSLHLVTQSADETSIMQSHMKQLCLPEYSNPPIHGARIVDEILENPILEPMWRKELAAMAQRLRGLRIKLVEKLAASGSKHDWSHILKQIGMFAYTGLTPEMVINVKREYSIHMPEDGRISVAGLNEHNLEHVANAFHQVSKDGQI